MRTTAYTNFSIFGLATIFIVGGLIIITSYTLEPCVIWMQRRRNYDAYASLEWAMNETLQLQRMAHEEVGMGSWRNCNKDVPITERRDRLAMLDLGDLEHPRLKAPPVPFEQILAGGTTSTVACDDSFSSSEGDLKPGRAAAPCAVGRESNSQC